MVQYCFGGFFKSLSSVNFVEFRKKKNQSLCRCIYLGKQLPKHHWMLDIYTYICVVRDVCGTIQTLRTFSMYFYDNSSWKWCWLIKRNLVRPSVTRLVLRLDKRRRLSYSVLCGSQTFRDNVRPTRAI